MVLAASGLKKCGGLCRAVLCWPPVATRLGPLGFVHNDPQAWWQQDVARPMCHVRFASATCQPV